MENYIELYWKQIENEQVVVGKYIKMIYKHLYKKLSDTSDGFHFDIIKANKPIEFIERFCRHSKGSFARKPIELELFQKAFIQSLYGFVDDTGLREYQEAVFIVARKNGS